MTPASPLVSIIIPAYNAADYIEECLASVAVQDFPGIETVVVNDASTDSTLEIIQEFAAGNPGVRIVDLTHNVGLSGARNIGIKHARGKYLYFLDSDDCLHPKAIRVMYDMLCQTGARICRSGFYRAPRFTIKLFDKTTPILFDSREAILNALYQKILMNSAWGMLIDAEIVKETGGFREGIWYEDLDVFYRFFERTDKIVYIKEPLYFYRENKGSFLGSWKKGRLDVLDVTDRIANHYIDDSELSAAAADRRFSAHFNILMLLYKNRENNPEAGARCLKVIREERGKALKNPKVRLKNKIGALLSYCGAPVLKSFARLFY